MSESSLRRARGRRPPSPTESTSARAHRVHAFRKLAALLPPPSAQSGPMPGVIYCGSTGFASRRRTRRRARAARLTEKALLAPVRRKRAGQGGGAAHRLEARGVRRRGPREPRCAHGRRGGGGVSRVSRRRQKPAHVLGREDQRSRTPAPRRSSRRSSRRTSRSRPPPPPSYLPSALWRRRTPSGRTSHLRRVRRGRMSTRTSTTRRWRSARAASGGGPPPRAWGIRDGAPARAPTGHVLAAGAAFRVWRFIESFDRNVAHVARATLAGAAGGCERAALAKGLAAGLREAASRVGGGADGADERSAFFVSPAVIFLAPRSSRSARGGPRGGARRARGRRRPRSRLRRGPPGTGETRFFFEEEFLRRAARAGLHARLLAASAWPRRPLLVRPLTNAVECVLVSSLLCLRARTRVTCATTTASSSRIRVESIPRGTRRRPRRPKTARASLRDESSRRASPRRAPRSSRAR